MKQIKAQSPKLIQHPSFKRKKGNNNFQSFRPMPSLQYSTKIVTPNRSQFFPNQETGQTSNQCKAVSKETQRFCRTNTCQTASRREHSLTPPKIPIDSKFKDSPKQYPDRAKTPKREQLTPTQLTSTPKYKDISLNKALNKPILKNSVTKAIYDKLKKEKTLRSERAQGLQSMAEKKRTWRGCKGTFSKQVLEVWHNKFET